MPDLNHVIDAAPHEDDHDLGKGDCGVIRLKAPTIADAIKSVEKLEQMIDTLKTDVAGVKDDFKLFKNDIGWIKNILIAILIALVVGIAIAIGTKFI